jgi:hypothetical protein
MKYTINYCKHNFVAVLCPTLEIYKKVTRTMKISGILRDGLWKHHKENTLVSFTFNSNRSKPYEREEACYGNFFEHAEIVNGEKFLEDNGIYITENYQIY